MPGFQVNPYLEAVIEVNPDALQIAENLDEERDSGNVRSSLHGIPVVVKDVCSLCISKLPKVTTAEYGYGRSDANDRWLLGSVGQ